MTAERGRAAPFDGREHTALGHAESLLAFELGAVRTDDVGDVESWPPGGCRAFRHDSLRPVFGSRSKGLSAFDSNAAHTCA
jgi:hypothetical protein